MKLPINLSEQNCEDLWSALAVWEKQINKKENPNTHKAIKSLIKRVTSHLTKIQKARKQKRKFTGVI